MNKTELIKGHTKMLVLSALAEKPKHGYDIFQWIKHESGNQFKFSPGMLYPLLHQMEKEKLLTAKWASSKSGPKRKNYAITNKGLKELAKEKKQWLSFAKIINEII
ncbi:MAG: helix-turn-helix transcriptional regulator [Patescibacteria group bacterium]